MLSVALGNEFHEVWADLQFASICDSLIPISRYIYAFGMNRETPDEEFLFFNSCLRYLCNASDYCISTWLIVLLMYREFVFL